MKFVTSFHRILVATTIVGALLAPAATNTTAQTNDYLVTLKGTSIQDGGKVKLNGTNLVSPPDVLVLRIIRNPPRKIQLQRRDASKTNVVAILLQSSRQGMLVTGQFSSDLELSDASFSDNDGDIQISGKETPATNPTKVKATLIGVLNDGVVNSANSDIDQLFKGTLTGTRLP